MLDDWVCSACGWSAGFKAREIPKIADAHWRTCSGTLTYQQGSPVIGSHNGYYHERDVEYRESGLVVNASSICRRFTVRWEFNLGLSRGPSSDVATR